MSTLDDIIKKDRFVNRRKMAWWSFRLFSGLGLFLVGIGLQWPDVVEGVWPQAMFMMGLWGSVVAGYFTVTWNTDKTEINTLNSMDPYAGRMPPVAPPMGQGLAQGQQPATRPSQPAPEGK